eukprot:3939742-Rhodomonas_salina.2
MSQTYTLPPLQDVLASSLDLKAAQDQLLVDREALEKERYEVALKQVAAEDLMKEANSARDAVRKERKNLGELFEKKNATLGKKMLAQKKVVNAHLHKFFSEVCTATPEYVKRIGKGANVAAIYMRNHVLQVKAENAKLKSENKELLRKIAELQATLQKAA